MFVQPLCIYPSTEDLDTIAKLGRCIAQGGASEVHHDDLQRRAADLEENNQDHAVGALAVGLYFRGPTGAAEVAKSLAARIGSGGTHLFPIPGLYVNCKASHWRTKQGLAHHHLLLRPRSMHANATYVMCIVPPPQFRFLILVGYATAEMLPAQVESRLGNPFYGAYVLSAQELQSLPPLKWTTRDAPVQISRQLTAWSERDLVKPCTDDLIDEIETAIGVPAAERWSAAKARHAGLPLMQSVAQQGT